MSNVIFTNYNCDNYLLAAQEELEDRYKDSDEWFEDEDVYALAWRYTGEDWTDIYRPALAEYLNGHAVVIRGSIGRWNGHSYGGDVIIGMRKLEEYFEDCDYLEISEDDSTLYLDGSHHDGTVSIAMRELTDEGIEYYREHEDDMDYGVIDELFYEYSKKPEINW